MNNVIECTTGELAKNVNTAIKLKMACMIWGGPGIGKSEAISQVALNLGYPMVDTRISQLDQVDLRGIPTIDQKSGCTRWATPEFFPTSGDGIWLFDEINSGTPSVQAALYQLINDRQLGEYRVPDGWNIIAAGNRESDGGVTYKMPAPLGNRFLHLYCKADPMDWCDNYAKPNGLDPRIIAAVQSGYLATGGEKQESAIYHFDRNSAAFLTPRSLTKCSKVLELLPDASTMRRTLICGLIGLGHGNELCAYLDMCAELPKLSEIRKDPKGVPVPKNPSVAYAVACALSMSMDITTVSADFTYLRRIKSSDGHELPEYRLLAIQDVSKRIPNFSRSSMAVCPDWTREVIALTPFLS